MKMLLMKPSRNVKACNEQGFTMLEMLFAFSIFCLIASFLPLLFSIMFNEQSVEARIQKLEWELFANQLKKELQSSDAFHVVNGELRLSHGEETTSFQHYQKLLRRRVDGKGHEVVLQRVERVVFEKRGNALFIEVNNSFGKTYHGTIYHFLVSG